MKVLAFSAYYTPEIAASMYLTEDIYKGIVDAGYVLEVYVPMPTRGISKDTRKEYIRKKIEKRFNGKFIIHRISMYRESKNSILRALRYLLINIAFIWKGIKTKADVIFVQSTPPTQGMMAGIISRIKHIPFVYNLQDIFPDSLVNTGMTSKGSLIWNIGRKIEDFSYRHAEEIVVISEDFKKNILAKGVNKEKVTVVPNWADVGGVYPVAREDNILFQRYKLDPRKFYISYCGNIGYTQNMDILIDAAKKAEKLSDVRFVIIGDGVDKKRISQLIEHEHIDNITILPFQPYEDIAHVFSLGDIGLIISKPGVGTNSVPSKTWSYMAAGKPIIASFDEDSELSRMIKISDCGIAVSAGDAQKLLDGIARLKCEKEELIKKGENGYRYLKTNLDKDMCIHILLDIIKQASAKGFR